MRVPNSRFCLLLVTFMILVTQSSISQNFVHSKNQNLIPNPSFEATNAAISRLDMEMQNFGIVKDWKATINSPDAYHPRLADIRFIHKSPNFLKQFGEQEPRTGEGKVGMYIAGGPYKEGVTAKLKQPLSKGKYYYFHMYVSLGEGISNSCTSSIGSYFTARRPKITTTSRFPLNIESSKMVCNTKGWTKVCGVYRAKGTEKYISLGYFSDSPKGKSVKGGGFDTAYYFVDDVLLMEMRNTKNLTSSQVCDMALDFSPVEFLVGESEAYKEIKEALDSYIQYVTIFKVSKVKIIGHADDAGSSFENEIMSAMRASNVKKYFVEQGIDESLIEIVAAGDTMPVVTADSNLDPESNNRVEIKIE
ncbi:outer membrane protein OmpA-like peptidoglycan-associated protein [Aquimarina sp. EL_43]|uniref:OmpA family protein n=2 Tax=Flavobacteriaceae TaxID=49546 RepID=UPI0018C94FDD|nr:OmpA family protein [Aquimarina sp. EL_43]MBG6170482.1 outer membrane protein OmpA-like peptidoglycan-associated protein [Aquimarina sp. EL_43]